MADDSKPLRSEPEPAPVAPPLAPEDARRLAFWLTWHLRSTTALLLVAIVVVALELADYGGPLWPVVGLSLIATTLGAIGTLALGGRVRDGTLRGSALSGAALLGATLAGYVYLVTVGSLNLELGAIPLHTLGLLMLGALLSLAVHARAIGARTNDPSPARAAGVTLALCSMLGALISAEILGLLAARPWIATAMLAPLATHLWGMASARRALRAYADRSARRNEAPAS